ncbi:uncharacterized protein EI90DRAFT_3018447 [Cantharellus anzutake]|uniref:uncharacterized protein n=1 Tax=Cantharellus anzutake TaxID=1750568 RepID=UPI00190682F7|nr:uncharacterized protein EI90DRAFT_3018447 [Cantharellus anzutake]KAF8326844.1 hypothetical protein EI90DRAFT_3018447 [Cantharellus anzutake]
MPDSEEEYFSVNSRSPWEALTPSPSPSGVSDGDSAGRLAPEIEEDRQGNVEYKLKLLSPTPERFMRLVTQMKWRLLAGQGEALYEIGVSDVGILVGLTREELDESLGTLERMAEELGATVIVQKEITIPATSGFGERPLALSGETSGSVALGDTGLLGTWFGADSSYSSDELGSWNRRTAPLSLRGMEDDGATGSVGRGVPRPIIRRFPYGQGPRFGFKRDTLPLRPDGGSAHPTPSSKSPSTNTTDVDSEADDDAAFAFDLDINSFASTPPPPSISSNPLPQPIHPAKKLLAPIDPQAKALERRSRSDERREGKKKTLATMGQNVAPSDTIAVQPAVGNNFQLPSTKCRPNKAADLSTGRSGQSRATDVSFAPRYIAEALVLRKAVLEESDTVNVELDLSALDFGLEAS